MPQNFSYTGKRSGLQKAMDLIEHLDNRIFKRDMGVSEGGADMPKRLKDKVELNGKTYWIDGYSNQELYERYVDLLEKEGLVVRVDPDEAVPQLEPYMMTFYATYKQNQEQNTIVNRQRVIKNHILPRLGGYRLDRINTTVLQTWFNELSATYSKETLLKIKNTLSPVLNSAVEDGYLPMNPLKSDRLEINGSESKYHKAIPKDKMEEIKAALPELEPKLKLMGGLLSYTGMRYEEVLGCRFEDFSNGMIDIQRAVVHPKRNQPIIKDPKTKTSRRTIPCPEELQKLLEGSPKTGFVLASDKDITRETPMSYMEARTVYRKFQKMFDISTFTPHDFRDTCATTWRKNGVPLDVVSKLLGHSKTEITEKRYIKYDEELLNSAKDKM